MSKERFFKFPIPPQEGLTFFQNGLLAYLKYRCGEKDFCWAKQAEMARDLGVDRKTFNRGLQELETKKLVAIQRRQHDTRVVFQLYQNAPTELYQYAPTENGSVVPICPPVVPKCPNCSSSGSTKKHKRNKESTCTAELNSQSKTLLDEWNRRFPETISGTNQLFDQNALIQLLTTHDRTPGQISALMDFIERQKSIGYYSRPQSLIQRSNQGNGPFAFVRLELQMEAQAPESFDERLKRVRAERHERERKRAAEGR